MPATKPDSATASDAVLPIFPLGSVLLPGGRMKLRIFEARYMDMIAQCMRELRHFGICLIAEGREVGAAAVPHAVGVEARIIDWDMQQAGLLGITVDGGRRFRILSHRVNTAQTVEADIRWLPEDDFDPQTRYAKLLKLLNLVIADKGNEVIAEPHRLDSACWLGHRLSEILPIPPLARLRLLELDDAGMRLDILQTYLRDHRLID